MWTLESYSGGVFVWVSFECERTKVTWDRFADVVEVVFRDEPLKGRFRDVRHAKDYCEALFEAPDPGDEWRILGPFEEVLVGDEPRIVDEARHYWESEAFVPRYCNGPANYDGFGAIRIVRRRVVVNDRGIRDWNGDHSGSRAMMELRRKALGK